MGQPGSGVCGHSMEHSTTVDKVTLAPVGFESCGASVPNVHFACGLRNEDWELYEKAALYKAEVQNTAQLLPSQETCCVPGYTGNAVSHRQTWTIASFSLITSQFWFCSFASFVELLLFKIFTDLMMFLFAPKPLTNTLDFSLSAFSNST